MNVSKFAFPVLALGALTGLGAGLMSRRNAAPIAPVRAEVAGVKLTFDRDLARDEATAAGGLSDRLAFIVSFPAFGPLPAKGERAGPAIAVTLTPKDDGLDPRERPAKLYARFLTSETFAAPGGLVLRRFERSSPYDAEDLYLAPPDGRSFFARCSRAQSGAPVEDCLSLFRDGALDVELRYPAILLERWDALSDGVHALLTRMRAASPRTRAK